jgi:hypothetical protein
LSAAKEKPPEINDFRGFVVDYMFEISNLDLAKNIIEVVDYMEHMNGAK